MIRTCILFLLHSCIPFVAYNNDELARKYREMLHNDFGTHRRSNIIVSPQQKEFAALARSLGLEAVVEPWVQRTFCVDVMIDRVIVELDGRAHRDKKVIKNARRDQILTDMGYHVVRITNEEWDNSSPQERVAQIMSIKAMYLE